MSYLSCCFFNGWMEVKKHFFFLWKRANDSLNFTRTHHRKSLAGGFKLWNMRHFVVQNKQTKFYFLDFKLEWLKRSKNLEINLQAWPIAFHLISLKYSYFKKKMYSKTKKYFSLRSYKWEKKKRYHKIKQPVANRIYCTLKSK